MGKGTGIGSEATPSHTERRLASRSHAFSREEKAWYNVICSRGMFDYVIRSQCVGAA